MPKKQAPERRELCEAIRKGWKRAKNRKLVELDLHINDPAFADAAVAAFNDIAG